MILVRPEDSLHKAWLLRLLTAIADNAYLAANLYFKGGTAASMLGYLDRFSVDLDFDLKDKKQKEKVRNEIRRIIKDLDLSIYYEDKSVLLFVVKYKALKEQRNTIKLSISDLLSVSQYKTMHLPEIDRSLICQTIESMFANKLVATTDRYQKYKTIAARDLYDLHYFFLAGFKFDGRIISARTGLSPKLYLKKLLLFIEKKFNQTIINEDLNTLLPREKFQKIRKIIKQEVVMFIKNNINDI